eukprot:CAMPEP_0202861562 /NCGR_PEP_ID=MMETSP1391-20130828/2921_1 /ASSEMBLY_ACC=CAM_ASM_000867 /TAXON_ID=1034604 /ORGANISM="Chlamydomonas leiostraca, Strain SAG 11-49" /LENGTH=122 /DNA_ID=CAMNT_0049540973 /DNA_START=232 /DNA_END=596 /DNA_ORIENTATION=+
MATWTRQQVAQRVVALGFTEWQQGWLQAELDGMKPEDKAFYLEGSDALVHGKLDRLLKAAAAAAAQPQPGLALMSAATRFAQPLPPPKYVPPTSPDTVGETTRPTLDYEEWYGVEDIILAET